MITSLARGDYPRRRGTVQAAEGWQELDDSRELGDNEKRIGGIRSVVSDARPVLVSGELSEL
jgi:hypothetical protein